ncbi:MULTISPECIES: alpha/beta fold hydrolase [unclassified Mycobacterium]|uniref:alpha/beta fold hydrolase n=1 Tax=unclassified Mycobacterium TaxID=2642494 RepID=UPI0029C772E3|nr:MULTISPECIES: alpha/beta fold hydrolase [unclassified Mycobacterium]
MYTSVSGVDGTIRQVSGAFFIPRGSPPQNGWRVISLAHATTGIDNGCGPSAEPDLRGYLPTIRSFVAQRYAVALSDYEGLGESGSHPFMEPRTAAFNVIDAVRALRESSPTVSTRWVAVGSSQGGQAAWAANELNSYYGDGIELLGSVAMAPAANITGVANLAWAGSLTEEQQSLYPLMIVGLERYNADLDERAFLHGRIAADKGALADCQSPVTDPGNGSTRADLKPDTLLDVDRLRDALQRIALPQRQLDKPMLVVNGTRDETVLAPWVSSAVSDSCRLGGQIERVEIPDAGHADLAAEADDTVQGWISYRFARLAPPSSCQTSP